MYRITTDRSLMATPWAVSQRPPRWRGPDPTISAGLAGVDMQRPYWTDDLCLWYDSFCPPITRGPCHASRRKEAYSSGLS